MPLTRSTRATGRFAGKIASWFAFGRNMHLIVGTGFAANVVGAANVQYLPLYIRRLGGTISDLGLFFALETVAMAVLVLVGGWLVDRSNRRVLFSLAAAVGGLSNLMMAVAPSWPWLIPGMCLTMLSRSIGGPVYFSLTSDIAPRQRRAAYFGYQFGAFSACAVVGPLLGGLFFQYLDYRWFLGLGAALGLTASYLRTLVRDPREDPGFLPEGGEASPAAPKRRRGSLADFIDNLRAFGRWALRTPGLLPFLVLINLPAIGAKMLQTYLSVYLNEVALLAPAAVGVLAAISGATAIPANLVGGRLGDAVGHRIAVSAAQLLLGFWTATLTLVFGFPAFGVLFVFDGLIQGGLLPSTEAWSAGLCPARHRGTYNAACQLLCQVLALPAPLAGSWLWARLGPAAPLRAAAAVGVLTAVLLFRFGPSPSRRLPSQEAAAPGAEA